MVPIVVLMTEAVIVEEQVQFTLPTLCQASGAAQEQVHALVNEGLLQPQGHGPQDWRFAGDALPRTRRALRLARDFGLDLAAVALVMELLTQIAQLRSQLRPP